MERNNKARLLIFLSTAGLAVSVLLGLCLGASNIRPAVLLATLAAGKPDDFLYRILLTVRLPRVTAALLAGSALAVSGAIIQSVLNNPLASPNIIGVNAGAGLLVLLASAFLPPDPLALPLSAFSGALLACLLVLAIAMTGRLSRVLLVLTGFAVNSMFSAGMNTVMILYPDAYVGAGNFLVGGLSFVTPNVLVYPSAFIAAGVLMAQLGSKGLNILNLGADNAKALGMNVNACRCAYLAIAAILAGAAVSFAGMIGFVGLLVPHGVKLVIGQDNRFVIPASALTGGMFVILCDLLARTVFLPYELPVGILMSFIGGPFFLYLILKNRRKE
ncbi:FecCD family ABC transporter permease [Lacrimispora saccharolytica]|uniref:Transport system permease protein n=1 Tax=Lacrimispora saccharolytica (strain ATCC 35040 / DSM 2544 / NRCC 2533 / WM1) TaxID=610130 RepID=D9QZC8_LACSW|nr:iron ABC transporter permease [Lacrimispora saccharolytica]ADL04379.1 transport system permease protein [[Clostridium] saccharolyticum WM1]QRV21354.1 iron ABC transporter permease [Lacrimispora saccharolytica]